MRELPSEVTEYLDHLAKERDVSPNTVRAYRRDLDDFSAFLGRYYGGERPWSWQGVDRLAMRAFLGASVEARVEQTVDGPNAIGGAQLLSVHAPQRDGRREPGARGGSAAAREVPSGLSRPRADRSALSDRRSARWEGKFVDVRNLAILELFYSTGMRLSELQGLSRRRPGHGLAAGQSARKGSKGAHHPDRRSRHARASKLRGEARRAVARHRAQSRRRPERDIPRPHGQADRRARHPESRDRTSSIRSTKTPG